MKIAVTIGGQLRDYKINVLNHIEHFIKPNNADVFIYACTKNTIHTTGPNITQKYNITSTDTPEQIKKDILPLYGPYLKGLEINSQENLDAEDFGTLGYFRKRMQDQMDNIRAAYNLASSFDDYDVIVRIRPDNSMFPVRIDLNKVEIEKNNIYSTIYPSGHEDPWFFSFSCPETFEKYSSFKYLEGEDDLRTDNDFPCPEEALKKFIQKNNIKINLFPSICLPFYEYDKTKPITNFPHRNEKEKLVNHQGEWVNQVTK